MALDVIRIKIQCDLIVEEKNYITIENDICSELRELSTKLKLGNLKHADWNAAIIFSCSQSEEILDKEIPLLRAENLSEKTQKALDGLESALRDTAEDPWSYLMLKNNPSECKSAD